MSAFRRSLCALQQSGDLDAMQAYCQKRLCTETDALFRGCLLWNLSDVYAMRRDSGALYDNHRRFEMHVNTMAPMYRLWLVCDSTQRLTLELGGHGDVWWDVYENAAAPYDPICEAVLFEAHRAAFYKSPQMPYDDRRAICVNNRFSVFLEQTCCSPSAAFYKVIYTALCLKHFGDSERDIVACCEPLLDDLHRSADEPVLAAGEWEALNRQRSSAEQAQVGINNAVNALIDRKDTKRARELYITARVRGLRADRYIETRL